MSPQQLGLVSIGQFYESSTIGANVYSLQDNMLTYIEPETFQGLINLQYLNLENNKLDLFTLPVDIFSDLINLSDLLIMQSKERSTPTILNENYFYQGTFPDTMFGNLTTLTFLSISTLQSSSLYFNKEFNNLNRLSSLTVSAPFCEIINNSFENVRFVQNLYLLHTSTPFSHEALRSFYNVQNITYSMIPMCLREAIQTLIPLKNKNLTYLRFHQVKRQDESRTLNYEDGVLTVAMEILEQICIENLILENNDLLIINFGWYIGTKLKKCLTSLTIFDNIIIDFSSIYSLQYLTVLKQVVINGITFTEANHDSRVAIYKRSIQSRNNGPFYRTNVHSSVNTRLDLTNCKLNGTIIDIPLNYSIESISLSSFLVSPITVVIIYSSESLLELSLTHLNLVEICFKPNEKQQIEGLPNLRMLNISFNDLSNLYPEFFDKYPSLEILSMQHSQLRRTFIFQYSYRLFQNLIHLQHLDISYNSLDMLSIKTFQTNPNLKSFNISLNKFVNIPFDLKLTEKLQILDISENAITTLSNMERDQIERNRENLGRFELYLSGNILSCGCNNLQFLKWLQMTNVMIDKDRNFTCINKEGVLSFTLAYSDIEGLWRECWGLYHFNIAMGLFLSTFIAFLLSFFGQE
ncbi:hypothetical protein Btru_037738 [Bulinus truncatus]|nr:hypothetical protein Btru_037738 [Bulinus truncatus]